MVLIYFSVKSWHTARGSQRRLLGLMLILYFSMTFMWALGTTNYGTAMRHHMLSWWIIVIIVFFLGSPAAGGWLIKVYPSATHDSSVLSSFQMQEGDTWVPTYETS
jgi:hypothetical protein